MITTIAPMITRVPVVPPFRVPIPSSVASDRPGYGTVSRVRADQGGRRCVRSQVQQFDRELRGGFQCILEQDSLLVSDLRPPGRYLEREPDDGELVRDTVLSRRVEAFHVTRPSEGPRSPFPQAACR